MEPLTVGYGELFTLVLRGGNHSCYLCTGIINITRTDGRDMERGSNWYYQCLLASIVLEQSSTVAQKIQRNTLESVFIVSAFQTEIIDSGTQDKINQGHFTVLPY